MTTLRTPRLILRPERLSDAPAIAALTGDWEVAKMIGGVSHPTFAIAAEGKILLNQARAPLKREQVFSATLDDDTLIGSGGLYWGRGAGPEIGYWVGRPYWGQGYGGEIAAALTEHALRHNTGPVQAVVSLDNPASAKVLERAGFVDTGERIERYSLTRCAPVTCAVMRLAHQAAA